MRKPPPRRHMIAPWRRRGLKVSNGFVTDQQLTGNHLLARYCLPAILKACTALKKDLKIDHRYMAKGSAPGSERKKQIQNKDGVNCSTNAREK